MGIELFNLIVFGHKKSMTWWILCTAYHNIWGITLKPFCPVLRGNCSWIAANYNQLISFYCIIIYFDRFWLLFELFCREIGASAQSSDKMHVLRLQKQGIGNNSKLFEAWQLYWVSLTMRICSWNQNGKYPSLFDTHRLELFDWPFVLLKSLFFCFFFGCNCVDL